MLYKIVFFLVEVDKSEKVGCDCVAWEWSKNYKG
jgi:hypothetical protein